MGQCGQSKTSTSVFDDGKALITPLIEGSIRDVELNGELLIVCSDNGSIKSFNCASVLQGNHVSLNHLTGHSKGVNKVKTERQKALQSLRIKAKNLLPLPFFLSPTFSARPFRSKIRAPWRASGRSRV